MEVICDNRYTGSLLKEAGLTLDHLADLAQFVLDQQQAPVASELSLSLVGNDEIARLNKEYRSKEGPTDVLSFECDDPWSEEAALSEEAVPIGDIVIAPEVAAADAPGYGVSFTEEMELLVVHGVLHLLGYDHIDPDDAAEMEELQLDLLDLWRKDEE